MSRTPGKASKKGAPPDDAELDELLGLAGEAPLRADGWPAAVPVLTAGDLVWNWSDAYGRHDLGEWLVRTFCPAYPRGPVKQYRAAYDTLCAVLAERLRRPVTTLWLFLEFTHKRKLPSKAWQAACWNEMLARLGYSVPGAATKDPGLHTKG